MTADPVRRIANRRRIIATLRQAAVRCDALAREYRERADRLEASTDQLEKSNTRSNAEESL